MRKARKVFTELLKRRRPYRHGSGSDCPLYCLTFVPSLERVMEQSHLAEKLISFIVRQMARRNDKEVNLLSFSLSLFKI